METYSITFELHGKYARTLKDIIVDIAKNNHATSIDIAVDITGDNDVDYDVKISFSDEKTLDKFIGDVREYLENN